MTPDKLKGHIANMASHVTFQYRGQGCGVDPLARDHFDMWCGDGFTTVNSLDAVMDTPFFFSKALKDIAPDITDVEY